MQNTDKPVLHACIIGIGRFTNFPSSHKVNRPACADSARAMVDMLINNADNLAVPLGTIECLISDPRDDPNDLSKLAKTHAVYDPRDEDDLYVEAGTTADVEAATNEWLNRIREGTENSLGAKPGDHILLYVCSHGVAGRDKTALAILEDTDPDPSSNKPYEGILDLKMFSMCAPACLLYTSPSPRDRTRSRMPSSA